LRIQLLGGFRVCVGSRLIEGSTWKLRKAAAIIKLLALAPHQQLHREQLMDLLWPDFEPQAAANNLRRTLYTARCILSPSAESRSLYLQGDPLTLCPDEPAWVDVQAFEAAVATARRMQDPASYRAAIALYTGDLLPEDRYEDWAASRREELRIIYLSLLSDLARLYEERGEIGPAIENLQRAVSSEPTHEDAHVGLMRLYARAGQRYQALQQYQQLREALLREINAEPDPNTRQVYLDILSNRLPSADPSSVARAQAAPSLVRRHNLPAPVTAFIGREREIVEVTRLLAQVRLLTLVGSGGCGKTRLAMEAASRLIDQYPDGVWLVELAALADPELVPQAVASALGDT
jgi:DNA-binding SARP family transcriptional activator